MSKLLIGLFVLGCGTHETQPDAGSSQHQVERDAMAPCSGSCEINDWPRVIVAAPTADNVAGELESGTVIDGVPRGCPELPSQFRCDSSLFPPSNERAFDVVVTSGSVTARHTVELRSYNTCGREIAYVEVDLMGDGGVGFSVRYINPCSTIDGQL